MSSEERIEIEVIPAQVKVIKHVKFVYSCRRCEKNEIETPIRTALMPKPALPGGMASSSAIAYVMSQKFVESMPLYRQEKSFERLGIALSRQTLANWMIQVSERWISKIYDRMKEHLVSKDIIHADETTLQVLHESGREAESNSYMWLYRTERADYPIVLYEYQTTRAGKHPVKFLENFKSYLHIDGYAGYNGLSNVILLDSWLMPEGSLTRR
jgi:transposase